MKLYWQTFVKVLLGMLERPVWLMLILSLCIMSMVYANRTVWICRWGWSIRSQHRQPPADPPAGRHLQDRD